MFASLFSMAAKRRRTQRKTPTRRGWVELISSSQERWLSPAGAEGLNLLGVLADNADERRRFALEGRAPARLTVRDLARDEGCSESRIYRLMRQAKIELFGKDLSDSAIYYRLRRDRERSKAPKRPCEEKGCRRPLPADATRRRRFCDFHLAGHARQERYRRRQRARSR